MKNTFFILLAVGLLSGCVTKKSRQEQSKVGQLYHNMTAKYNGWFNANELLEASILKLEEQQVDNFNELLPLYEYAAVDNADAVKPDLDEAIKKVSVVVTLHEYSDWADDCYLLIGKAEYLKRDYEAAENALEFYMDEFQPNGKRTTLKERKRKKGGSAASDAKSSAAAKEANRRQKELQKARKKAEKERKVYNKALRKRKKKGQSTDDLVRPGTVKAPDGTTAIPTPDAKKYEPSQAEVRAKLKAEGEQSSIFLNEPVYDEAILWLAKTYIERENWTSADYQFRRLETDDVLLPVVYEELPVARAYYHIKRENFPQVIPFLEQAIERTNKRANKARYAYIIGQLHERAGNTMAANEFFQKSLDFANQYDMEFNTELSILRSAVKNKTMSRVDAQVSLEKMAKDYKNVPYLGRIYYVMADLALAENDVKGAIAHLEKSVETVGTDKYQAIESQYLLAKLYMQEMMYVEADGAYKATAAIMEQTDPRYREVKKLADNLTEIAINLTEIELQDSLLILSYKTDDELKALAKEIKKMRQKEAEEAAAKSKYVGNADKKTQPANPALSRADLPAPIVAAGPTASFWAFDTKNLKKTRREFERTWGDIGLTDYWRVSDKANQFTSTEENLDPGAEGDIGLYESEIEDFFRDVPKNDSARALSHASIRKSMLLLGQLYRDRLEDFNSSITILEAILEKYPDAPEKLEIYYQLYLSALSSGDHARADKYKSLIIELYPNSRFAKVLSDPNFAASQQSEKDRLVQYYDETFDLFDAGQHEVVLTRVRDVEHKFGLNNILMGKFELLKAMSLGAQVGKEAYVDALKYIIARYPNSDEEKKAKDMLLLLGDASVSKGYGETGLSDARFQMEDNALHFVIIYVQNQDQITINDAKIAVAEFHKKFFQLDNLKMTNLVFDPSKNHSLILVRSFTTKDKAMKYYETAVRNPNVFLPANAVFEVYPITQKNYREVIKARELESYKAFFEANY